MSFVCKIQFGNNLFKFCVDMMAKKCKPPSFVGDNTGFKFCVNIIAAKCGWILPPSFNEVAPYLNFVLI